MRIGLQDIDPHVGQALLERLASPTNNFLRDNIHWGGLNPMPFNWEWHAQGVKIKRKRDPGEDEKRAHQLRKQRDVQVSMRTALTIFAPLVAGAVTALGLESLHASGLVDLIGGMGTWGALTGLGSYWTLRATPKARLWTNIRLEEMRAAFPLLSLTRAERIYCDTLLLLARTEVNAETERTMRDTLRQLNDLLLASRQLEQKRLGLLPLLGNHVLSELEAEYGVLGRRLDETADPLTRQSLEQSLQMCSARLQNARALEQGLERLKAQQEAMLHTISSAQSALARLQLAPQPQTEGMAQEISQTVAQMNQQTLAVEQAVEEVMTLRSF